MTAKPDEIANMGGPVAVVLAWLDREARSEAREEREARSHPMALF